MPWLRLAVGIFVAAQTMLFGLAINITPPDDPATRMLLHTGMLAATLAVLALLGWPLAKAAARELASRRITMELLFLVGLSAAMGISCRSMLAGEGPVYFEVVCVLLVVYTIGHAINAGTRRRAISAVEALASPISTARLVDGSGTRHVAAEQLVAGNMVRVMPGELIPADGRVVGGRAMVRQTAFTGEWLPAVCGAGDAVFAATACEDGTLDVEVTSAAGRRRIDRLAALIDSARRSPASLQRQADRFVRWFLPIVLTVSVGTLIYWADVAGWQQGLFNALAVLLVACPCAAGLATPLAIWSAMARLSRDGLLLRSGDAVERLAAVDGVIFDKTGTLGEQRLTVCRADLPSYVQAAVAAVERLSGHPAAVALRELATVDGPAVEVEAVRILSGRGIEADIRIAGGPLQKLQIVRDDARTPVASMRLRVNLDGENAGTVELTERLRSSAKSAIDELARLRLPVQIMTGDSPPMAAAAQELAPTTAGMTPQEKHRAIRGFGRPLFVGDGVNDAAAMAASHASIALAEGAEVTVESASATLHGGDLSAIPRGIVACRSAVRAIRMNLLWAAVYNAVGIFAAAMGWLHPVLAAVLMAASSAWVSFRSADPTPSEEAGGVDWNYILGHSSGLIGQGVILACLADVPIWAVAIPFAALAYWIIRRGRRWSTGADMILGMVSLGGLGMNLGWWADLGFTPALHAGHGCCAANSLAGAVIASPWMYIGMLLVGVPAMYVLRHTPERFSWRRWCCVGPLVVGVPGMMLGMWGGSLLAGKLMGMNPSVFVIVHYVLMMAGMCAGMLVAHVPAPHGRG